MSKEGLVASIQAVADVEGGNLQIALGTPGAHVENSIGEMRETGQAWEPEPKTWPVVCEGMANSDGKARQMTSTGDLLPSDRRIELAENNVTVDLPDAGPEYVGTYIIKSLGKSGGRVSGTIDGSPAIIPVVDWEFLSIYCNGTDWLTG